MEITYPNRMIEGYQTMSRWPAVKIVKGLPEHPEGAIRYPRPEQREQWERQGICVLAPEHDGKTAPGGNLANMRSQTEQNEREVEPAPSAGRKKRGKKR